MIHDDKVVGKECQGMLKGHPNRRSTFWQCPKGKPCPKDVSPFLLSIYKEGISDFALTTCPHVI